MPARTMRLGMPDRSAVVLRGPLCARLLGIMMMRRDAADGGTRDRMALADEMPGDAAGRRAADTTLGEQRGRCEGRRRRHGEKKDLAHEILRFVTIPEAGVRGPPNARTAKTGPAAGGFPQETSNTPRG